jgi:hypothetical protein
MEIGLPIEEITVTPKELPIPSKLRAIPQPVSPEPVPA